MAVNRYKNHLAVYLEDEPYRGIVNGVKTLPNVNDHVIDVRPPCGGWPKVFAELRGNLRLLNDRKEMHAVLLIDFDNEFAFRKQRFEAIIAGQPCCERVFLLGIDNKESEDLKASLKHSNNEAVGKLLLSQCPDEPSAEWQSSHLQCNESEIKRLQSAGVLDWLFVED